MPCQPRQREGLIQARNVLVRWEGVLGRCSAQIRIEDLGRKSLKLIFLENFIKNMPDEIVSKDSTGQCSTW